MRAAKAWYFLYFSALSTLFPFLNLYFRRLGLRERQIGVIGAARPFISLPGGSLWSGAADKSRRHRAVLLGTFVASVAARLAVAAVGHAGLGFAALLVAVLCTEFFAAPVTIIVDSAVMAACSAQGDYGRQRLFGALGWGLFSAVAGSAISHAGVYAAFVMHAALATVALLPTLKLPFGPLHAKLAQQAEQLSGWAGSETSKSSGGGSGSGSSSRGGSGGRHSGRQAWDEEEVKGVGMPPAAAAGSVAEEEEQSLLAAVGGASKGVDRFDSALEAQSLLRHANSKSSTGSGSMAANGGAAAHDASGGKQQQRQQRQHVSYWAGVRQLLRNPEASVFLAMAVTMGFGVGNIEGYLFLYLDELGGSELLMGLSLSVTCAAESLVFFFLPQILQRLGIRRCMHLVFAAFLLRMACYAGLQYAPSPWMVLPAEVLHGFTFALAWGAGCQYCAQLSPPGLEATTQGLFQGLYFGIGVGVGSLAGGFVYQQHGAQAVYLAACAVLAAGWVLCSLAQLAVGRSGWAGSSWEQQGCLPAGAELSPLTELEMGEVPGSSK